MIGSFLSPIGAAGGSGEGGGSSGGSTASGSSTVTSVTVTAGSTPHTKGATPTQFVASTSHNIETLMVYAWSGTANNADTSMLLDIMTGALSSETVLIGNIQVGDGLTGAAFVFPIAVASGTRLSARCQGAVSSDTIGIGLGMWAAGDHSQAATASTTYGANTTTSRGTTLTTAVSTNTKSAWTVIDASTASAMTRLVVSMSPAVPAAVTTSTGKIDIGYGAEGVETVVAADIPFALDATEWIRHVPMLPYSVNIPAGSRLVARYESSSTAAGAVPSVVVHGFV